MSDPVIRALTAEDLDDALTLSTIAGWNQRLDDWRFLHQLAPAGAFAAALDTHIVGTAIGIDYGGFAWIAMMLVDPVYRGRGIGARLLEAALNSVPRDLPVRLDATALGRPLYQRYGFKDESMLSRHVMELDSQVEQRSKALETDQKGDVERLTASDLWTVTEQDSATFGGTRTRVLEWAFRGAPHYAHVVRSGDSLINYCLGRPGRLFDQIGPVVATRDTVAQGLVSAALSAAGNRPLVVDAFDAHAGFTAWLRSRGFSVQRPLVRMCRSVTPPAWSTEVRSSLVPEFAILGPEFA